MLLGDYNRIGGNDALKGWAALPVVQMHQHMVDALDEADADPAH
jgi:hypothetical protein